MIQALRHLGLLSAGLFVGLCLSGEAAAKPNVILIMADDLGYGDLGCYGAEDIKTPHLDTLAKEGMRLTNFYCGATVCTPSRMALLSGTYPVRLGWRGGVLGYKMKTNTGLAPDVTTLADMFKSAGYSTYMSGKWHIGSSEELSPIRQGFDSATWIPLSNNQCKTLFKDQEVVQDPFENRLLSEVFTTAAKTFIREHADKPFFLYMPYTAPHFPVEPHPDWEGKSKRGKYGDVVEELDSRIGEVMALLKKLKIDENTLVIFTSDNGPQKGQLASAGPLRGMKWSALEGGNRVPALFRWPGGIPAGQSSDAIVAAVDMLPSLATVAGVNIEDLSNASPSLDGVNAWPAIVGKPDDTIKNRDLLVYQGWSSPLAIRKGSFKLFVHPSEFINGSDAGPVLINLDDDITEEKNVADQFPEKVDELKKLMRTRLQDIDARRIQLGGIEEESSVPKPAQWLN
jgi:arylsulfatase A-like enzyme